ncbi:hypothetical protein [Micromonospora sp. NPDC023633]
MAGNLTGFLDRLRYAVEVFATTGVAGVSRFRLTPSAYRHIW